MTSMFKSGWFAGFWLSVLLFLFIAAVVFSGVITCAHLSEKSRASKDDHVTGRYTVDFYSREYRMEHFECDAYVQNNYTYKFYSLKGKLIKEITFASGHISITEREKNDQAR